ncbi:CRISPR-associated protein Cas4 [Candidatus Nitrospira inopinata]|jgi:CRISPR-associated exonuclease Cas4|uniref:CRISPR-associated exonuclease Cas4 n=1 Tax=Candidatus Nitrospira inopinata TaxID=1715989 RepID=A0A0S4L0L1_9BACT|nr:CRISPR-associated protein Cas4 [Candidatus Nitrospira inopinata]CUQ67554.1 CRISPR-associated exonuclease, Cas4 family [Candidatus Nitrospira inopinata]
MADETGEENLVFVSALNQYAYCPRRCALIYGEQTFDDNVYTMRGRDLHERTDQPMESGWEEGVRVERGLPLWSKRLGLIGKADVVEFHGDTPYPVEYKSGPKRRFENDDLQVCAQALCLEEMTGKEVPRGAIYHHSSRRRREVIFTPELRRRVEEAIVNIRQLLARGTLPPPVNDRRCERCSLIETCMPSVIGEQGRARALVRGLFLVKDS